MPGMVLYSFTFHKVPTYITSFKPPNNPDENELWRLERKAEGNKVIISSTRGICLQTHHVCVSYTS